MALRFLRDGTFTGSVSADSYISTTDAGININGITLSRVAANSAIRVGDGLETLGLLRSYANLIVATTGNFGGNVTVGSGLGAVATDGVLQINGGSGSGGEAYLNLTRGGSSGFILNHTATAIQVRATANIPMFFYTNDTLSLKINANNTISLPTYGAGYLKTDGSGNVTADSSAPGTGVFLPLAGGTMTGNNGVTFPDDFYLYVGTSNDLRIYHNSTNGSNIWNTVGHLTIQNTADNQDINFKNDNGAGGNATYFYLDGSLTNGTTTLGATRFPDNSKIFMGTGGDLVFNHDGTNSFIDNLTGDFTIENAGDDLILKAADDFLVQVQGTDIAIQAVGDGKVGLRYNNVEKFQTTNTGVSVTGAAFINGNTDNSVEFLTVDDGDPTVGSQRPHIKFTGAGTQLGKIRVLDNGVGMQFLNSADSIKLTIADSGNATFAGKVITTEVESASTLLLDAAADITIDAGGGDIILSDDATIFGTISSSGGMQIRSRIDDADMFFRGVDNGTEFNAITLDMSEGGNATFAGDVISNGNIKINTGSHLFFDGGTNATYISEDVADRLRFFVGGAEFMRFTESTADTVNIFKDTTFAGDVGMATGHSSGKFAVMSSAVHGSYDFYNQGTSYFNGTVTVDAAFTQTGGGATTLSGTLNVAGVSTLANVGYLGDGLGSVQYTLQSANNGFATIDFGDVADSNIGRLSYNHNDNSFLIRTNNATALTLDSSQNATFAGRVTAVGFTSTSSNVYTGGMSSFETTLTNNDDWQNSPITILERGNVQGTQTADKYAPNLNFHWGAKYSASLWMDVSGALHYGSYSGAGIPSTDGTIRAATFSGDLNGTINTATLATTQVDSVDNDTVATTAYVNNKIQLIPAGLVFQGTWNAATNTPTLASGTGTTGNFYIVSTPGSTNLDGITDWKTGDWAVFIEQGASDQWEKIDNSSVLDGIGTGQTLPLWSGSGTSNTLTDSRFTQTSTRNQILGPGNAASDYSLRVANAANTEQLYIQGTGEVVVTQNYFYVAASQGMYSNGLARFRGGITNDQTTLNLGGNGYSSNLQLTSGGASGSARFYGSTETTGNVVTGPNITAIGNTGNSTLTLQANTGNWTFTNVQASRNLEISDSDGTGTVMTIDTSGNVGIGTTGPQALLDVRKDIATIYDPLQDLGQRSGTATIHITNQDTTVGSFGQIMYDSDGSNQGIARIVFVDSGTASVDTAFVNEHNNTKAERMRITSAGNVGIGTDSPNDILHVSKAAAATRLRVGNNGAYDASIYFNTSTDWSIGTDTSNSNSLTFGNSSAIGTGTKMVIETNGNVGIGTTNPGQKLHINDGSTVTTTDANNMLLLTRDNHSYIMFSCPDEKDSGLHFHNTTDNTFVGRIAYSHESAGDHMLFTVNNSTRIDINYNGDVRFNSYGAGTLITDSSGNITVSSGGGAGGPYLPLSAGSGFPLTGHLFIDTPAGASQSGYALKLNKTNSSSQVQVGAEIFATPWASNTNGGTIIFKNADTATNLQETLRISANGSVGINSTSSSYKLDVGGNARFQDSVYIDTSTGAGGLYVTRLGSPVESLKIYTSDSTSVFETFQDENTGVYGSMAFILDNGAPDPVYDFKYGSIVRLRIEGGTGDVILGDALLSNQENTDVDTGTETVASVAIATYTAAFFDFVIKKGTNVRSGTVYACHDGTNVEFTETSTNDLGDTSDVTLSVDISGGNMRLRATTTSDDWSVKSLIRAI